MCIFAFHVATLSSRAKSLLIFLRLAKLQQQNNRVICVLAKNTQIESKHEGKKEEILSIIFKTRKREMLIRILRVICTKITSLNLTRRTSEEKKARGAALIKIP